MSSPGKNKDELTQDNIAEWVDMWTIVLVSYRYKNPTKHVDLVQSRHLSF